MYRLPTRWSFGSALNAVLGIWLIISPFVLGFARLNNAEWNNVAVGAAILLIAASGGGWVNIVLGLWEIVSPWALGFSNSPTALWNNLIIGLLVLVSALSAFATRPVQVEAPPTA